MPRWLAFCQAVGLHWITNSTAAPPTMCICFSLPWMAFLVVGRRQIFPSSLEIPWDYQQLCSKSWRSISPQTHRALASKVTRCIIRAHSTDRLMGVQQRPASSKIDNNLGHYTGTKLCILCCVLAAPHEIWNVSVLWSVLRSLSLDASVPACSTLLPDFRATWLPHRRPHSLLWDHYWNE